jgi:hypothetical protein
MVQDIIVNKFIIKGLITKKPLEKYSIKLLKKGNLNVGMATDKINPSTSNYNVCGYYLYTGDGKLYGQGGISSKALQNSLNNYKDNDIVGVKYDKKKGTISFYLNGKLMGVGFTDIKGLKLYASLDSSGVSKSQLVKGKFKK